MKRTGQTKDAHKTQSHTKDPKDTSAYSCWCPETQTAVKLSIIGNRHTSSSMAKVFRLGNTPQHMQSVPMRISFYMQYQDTFIHLCLVGISCWYFSLCDVFWGSYVPFVNHCSIAV